MNCPAAGSSFFDRVDRFGRLRAGLPTRVFAAPITEQIHSVPRLPRDFYFRFSANHAGNADRPAGSTLLSRSFP